LSSVLFTLDDDINPSINSIVKHLTKAKKKGKKWIKAATEKGEGKLREFAEEHRLLNEEGNIDLRKTERYIKRNLKGKAKKVRQKQVQLAGTLRRLRS